MTTATEIRPDRVFLCGRAPGQILIRHEPAIVETVTIEHFAGPTRPSAIDRAFADIFGDGLFRGGKA